jgi:hypothetical protein
MRVRKRTVLELFLVSYSYCFVTDVENADEAGNEQMKGEGEENADKVEEVAATWSNLRVQKSQACEEGRVVEKIVFGLYRVAE